MDVWVWLAFVSTGIFAPVPLQKNADCALSEALRSRGAVPGTVPDRASGASTVTQVTAPRGSSHGELSLPPGPFLGTVDMLV